MRMKTAERVNRLGIENAFEVLKEVQSWNPKENKSSALPSANLILTRRSILRKPAFRRPP
jgi:hypothetical protein